MRSQQSFDIDDEEELVALPRDIVEQIDEQLAGTYTTRTAFIRAATNQYINNPSST